jgi:hypothetical protein
MPIGISDSISALPGAAKRRREKMAEKRMRMGERRVEESICHPVGTVNP